MAQYNYAAHQVLNNGALPGGPQLHILGGDPGDAHEGYDLDDDAIVDDDGEERRGTTRATGACSFPSRPPAPRVRTLTV